MRTIELQKGEYLKVIGQKGVHAVLVNVGGEIFNNVGANRDRQPIKEKPSETKVQHDQIGEKVEGDYGSSKENAL